MQTWLGEELATVIDFSSTEILKDLARLPSREINRQTG